MAQQGLVRINQNENCGNLKERHMIKCEKMSGWRKNDGWFRENWCCECFLCLTIFFFLFSRKRRNEVNQHNLAEKLHLEWLLLWSQRGHCETTIHFISGSVFFHSFINGWSSEINSLYKNLWLAVTWEYTQALWRFVSEFEMATIHRKNGLK